MKQFCDITLSAFLHLKALRPVPFSFLVTALEIIVFLFQIVAHIDAYFEKRKIFEVFEQLLVLIFVPKYTTTEHP